MKSRLLALPAILTLAGSISLAGPATSKESVALQPDAPIRFVAGEPTELSFELVATDADGNTAPVDADRFPDAEITAELKFFCYGGKKIGNPVVTLRPADGSYKTSVQVPGAAMSADLFLSIAPLPDDVESEFKEPHGLIIDQTVERSGK